MVISLVLLVYSLYKLCVAGPKLVRFLILEQEVSKVIFGVCETTMVLILTTSIHQFLKLAETLGRDEIYNWGNFILAWSPLRDLSALLIRNNLS